ncbi:gamma-glutamyltransferase [Effusibacillus lacus]|uniref:Glutathione hydrolase proenzyme n=1 Tax=Effusibacillus lacus TaxID=1348429 RepID=A0A292YQA5_9BACL|nr:gamma-glutamyltransferase [Effusibacillus lacus]TCS70073.1 gamma-glutamyltranspeptidase/glutathione hydrolase [Effusibacillus lacus]GAX91089.1 gamma-glutamyltransferase [Effusibacillus lacus]
MRVRALALASAVMLASASPALARVPGVDDKMLGATQGMVAVSHPLAAQAGKEILAKGGNAVDAAAAIQLSLNVVEPMMSGIGGGGFMMIYLKDQNKITILDSREMAPKNVDPKLFLDKDGKPVPWFERHTGGKAVGVPGTLKGVETALAKYGTMKLADVIDPAIAYAENGVPVNWATAMYIKDDVKKLQQYGTAGQVFVPNGTPLQEGDLLVQPDLAKTLKLIKEKGSDVLYNGEVGEALVAEVQKRGGTMTMEDLRNYTVKEREPVRGTYRGYEIASMSPPSSGGLTILQILKLMEGYDVQKMGLNSADYLHRLIEAMHLAYADRAQYMADEDFYPVPKKGLIDENYIKERRKLINPNQASNAVKAGDPWKYEGKAPGASQADLEEKPVGQTTHFSVMDKWGNMVAYTTTIEAVFGSGIMVPGYGFMLNNEMTDFDATPGGVNQVEPGKRPRSSMSPTMILKDGKPFMAVGSPGGPTIITSVAQTILNVIDHKLPIQEAILAPRIYSSTYPNVRWEAGIEQDVILQLMAKGHVFDEKPENIGNVQAVIFDYENGIIYGGADDTREGTVLGVDRVSFRMLQPQSAPQREKGPFNLQVNGAQYPYYADQKVLKEGTSYILADKLMLGLGAANQEEFKPYIVEMDGKSYLPVRKVAEMLGYKVSWSHADSTVLLEKARPAASTEMQDYYKDDKYQITK